MKKKQFMYNLYTYILYTYILYCRINPYLLYKFSHYQIVESRL